MLEQLQPGRLQRHMAGQQSGTAARLLLAEQGIERGHPFIIERVERLEEDKAAVMNDMKEVFAEAKGEGFDVKILRKIVRLRKQDRAKRLEEEALIDLYLSAIGGL
jgi:uncharacterized protein (UPF0335 family)